jgi:hypothetical protein
MTVNFPAITPGDPIYIYDLLCRLSPEIGSPNLILMAKSGIRAIDFQYKPENRVCQRAHSCETDFAISIKPDEDPKSIGKDDEY